MRLIKITDKGEKNFPTFCKDGSLRMEDFLDEADKIKKVNGTHSKELVIGVKDLEFHTIKQTGAEVITLTKYWTRPEQGVYAEKRFKIEFPQKSDLELGKDILLEEKSYTPGEDLFEEYKLRLLEADMWRKTL